jgi:purine-nucleoside phosphorylase
MSKTQLSLYDKVMDTRDRMAQATDCKPVIGVILGSGLGALADSLDNSRSLSYADLPHIPKSTVPGHSGRFVAGEVDDVPVAVLAGRSHYYEGHDLAELTIGVRALIALGCRGIIVTNAAGGIHSEYRRGDLMVIMDHINMQWNNPLRGLNDERLGERFIDMTMAYDRKLRRLLHQTARSHSITLQNGVYACISGPTYETPAEIRMLRTVGADAIGMSTVHEVIAARHAGARVVGISLISNLAAGIEDAVLSHKEVTATAASVATKTVDLLKAFIPKAAAEVTND